MTTSIRDLVADETLVALAYRQALDPVEGRDVPVHPPTYPPPLGCPKDERPSPYTLNPLGDGRTMCELDSVASQATRMEASFRGELGELVPRHAVRAGSHLADLTELPHRLADAALRATALGDDLDAAFGAFISGDAEPLARLGPTTLVYGAWDSRRTRAAVRRAVASRIEALDVEPWVRSAQCSGAFGREALGLTEAEWRKAAQAGLAPAPSGPRPGGVLVRGEIVQSASVLVAVLRRYRTEKRGPVLAPYLAGLALGGLVTGGRRYLLRSGCELVPAGPARIEAVYADGARRPLALAPEAVVAELADVAKAWSEASGVTLGGEARVHHFDPERARRILGAKDRDAA